MGKSKRVLVVLCTTPEDVAEDLARRLVEERLAACVNITKSVTSFYWWEGKVQKDRESLLIIKTTEEAYESLEKRIKEIHPYTVPEILGIRTSVGSEEYIRWVFDEVDRGSR